MKRYACPVKCGFETDSHGHWMAHHCAGLSAAVPTAPPAATPEGDKAPALARQEGGGHYKSMAIQPFEYTHANGLGFAEGCVVKYVSRWRAKNGVEDLKKARHFLDLLIEVEGGK